MKIWIGALRQARKLNSWKPLCDFAGLVDWHFCNGDPQPDDGPRPYCPRCILTRYFQANQSILEKKYGLASMFLFDQPDSILQPPGVLLYKCHWLKSATNPWGITYPGTVDEYYDRIENTNSWPRRKKDYEAEYVGLWCEWVIVWIKRGLA